MKKGLIIILGALGGIILFLILDIICIFHFNRPILAVKEDNGDSVDIIYRGILYDTYYCHEFTMPQIKAKNTKFSCSSIITSNKDLDSAQ